ncbi:MAG: hypothetical protein Udaeo_13740 [Candidatus Udaeobacter sp.]|nr:MAG: hypothetical protein Udaeo_13740 [Candidatus Udaeobacter sp.]
MFVEGELPPDFRGRSEHERAGRNFHPHRDQRVCADDGACAYFHIVENDSAHADEHFIVDFARVNNRGMADGHQFAYDCWVTGVHVDDSVVLNVRARPDDDAVDIAAQDCAIPDTRFLF